MWEPHDALEVVAATAPLVLLVGAVAMYVVRRRYRSKQRGAMNTMRDDEFYGGVDPDVPSTDPS